MTDTALTDSAAEDQPAPGNPYLGLMLILAGIIAGSLLGVFYGYTMWRASGGPEKALVRLEETHQQKETFIAREAAAGNQDEVARLTAQLPTIDEEIAKVRLEVERTKIEEEAGSLVFASYVWTFTKFFGDLFIQVLKLLVIPLVMTSMITGITSLGDVRKVGRVGGATLLYYFTTGAVAVFIGIVLVVLIKPGLQTDDTFAFVTESVIAKQGTSVLETLLDVFRGREGDPGSGMFPSNIFQAATNTNVLALIVFAILFGGTLTTIGEKGKIVITFFQGANEAIMKMVHLVMIFAPIGIFGLVASNIAKNGGASGFADQLSRIGWYVGTVMIGLAIHSLVLAILVTVLGRKNPITYTLNMLKALMTSLSTASSAATLPITMECVEENNKVSKRAASFVLPLGATINMDGTALYEAVAVIFIAQSLGIELAMGSLIIIFLTASLAAVGAAGIPEAGLVTMVIVLQAVGLPMEGIGIILAIDWFLDRLRTTVNVYGDACGAAVIDTMVIQKQVATE
ncbi:MAG: sodium:dicarboxylate symporter [Blastopirellula sp.]|nr:MAG: sodium:dicarboxylate symporter [Blastopirellula sp.]